MELLFEKFKNDISDLRKHIKYIEDIKNVVDNNNSIQEYLNSTTKKKFNYKSLIISIYGTIEFYSEAFLKKYLEMLNLHINEYDSLKDLIKTKNLNNSISLIQKIIEGKHSKYHHLDKIKIIENLYNSINNKKFYEINKDSFTLLSGNLKHKKICDLFNQIGINLEKEFTKFSEFSNTTSEVKYQKIDEIVERRNEIAHGAFVELLDTSEIKQYIDFVYLYFSKLFTIIFSDLKQQILSYQAQTGIKLNNTTHYSSKIFGFIKPDNLTITKKDYIIVKKSSGYYYGKIDQIKRHKDLNSISIKLKNININNHSNEIYLIKKELPFE